MLTVLGGQGSFPGGPGSEPSPTLCRRQTELWEPHREQAGDRRGPLGEHRGHPTDPLGPAEQPAWRTVPSLPSVSEHCLCSPLHTSLNMSLAQAWAGG